MDPTITTASIALFGTLCLAGVTFLGTMITLYIGLRGLKIERVKILAETSKIRAELDESRQHRLAKDSANLDVEKQKSINLLENRKNIYAEMLELVYRLRNQLRDIIQKPVDHDLFFGPAQIGEELYLLTENLYKYRAYIDEETFEMLHQYKRLLQDVQVLINRMTRPPETQIDGIPIDWKERDKIYRETAQKAYEESKVEIENTYLQIDKSYEEITLRIQSHIESVLLRKS